MKTESSIKLEYQQVVNQARNLDTCSDELRRIAGDLDQVIDSLRAGWEGESANLFCAKCQELYSKIKRSSSDLDNTSSVIKRTAKIYRDTELAAIRIVQD